MFTPTQKSELVKVSTDLYEITARVETRLLSFFIPLQVLLDAVILYFDFSNEWIIAVANIAILLFSLFFLSKIGNKQEAFKAILKRLQDDWPKENMEFWLQKLTTFFERREHWLKPFIKKETVETIKELIKKISERMIQYEPDPRLEQVPSNKPANVPYQQAGIVAFILVSVFSIALGFKEVKAAIETPFRLPAAGKQPAARDTTAATSTVYDSILYVQALKYASIATEEKIVKDLVQISDSTFKDFDGSKVGSNIYISVYAVKDTDKYYQPGNYRTAERYNWVFTKRDFFNKYIVHPKEDSILRVKELLGLPPNYKSNYVIEFRVNPKTDLFRPCPDQEISDCACGLDFPPGTPSSHRSFITNWRTGSYNNLSLKDCYPFTGLGYTFDWNPYNLSHIGVSEFVIHHYHEIQVARVFTLATFLRTGGR